MVVTFDVTKDDIVCRNWFIPLVQVNFSQISEVLIYDRFLSCVRVTFFYISFSIVSKPNTLTWLILDSDVADRWGITAANCCSLGTSISFPKFAIISLIYWRRSMWTMQCDVARCFVSYSFLYCLRCTKAVCSADVGTQVWNCGLRATISVTNILCDAWPWGAIYFWSQGIGARFDECLRQPSMIES